MRTIARLMVVGLTLTAFSAPVASQRTADDQLTARSVELVKLGNSQYSAGQLEEAEDLYETALAVDPRNRAAFVAIARVAERQKLHGKAIRMTNRALQLEPNDLDAIAVQGEAMVELGAVARAQANLQKLQQICRQGCAQVAQLSAAISRGPTVAQAKPPETPKNN
jgi:Tfp pilus assembly protein PilF